MTQRKGKNAAQERTEALRDILEECSEYVTGKAAVLVTLGKLQQDNHDPHLWWVQPRPGTTYRVQVLDSGGYIICDCEHGRNASGKARCYHSAAVLTKLIEEHRA